MRRLSGRAVPNRPRARALHDLRWPAYPTDAPLEAQAAQIAAQNDRFRQTLGADPSLRGRVVATASVEAEGAAFLRDALEAIRAFDAFTADNDPHGWHDFGAVSVTGTLLW